MNPDNSTIPQNIQKALLTESGNRCANPACNVIIDSASARHCVVFQPGVTHVDNFISLCATCHHAYANGQINQAAIQAWKVLLLALTGEIQTRQMDMKLGALRNYPGLQSFFPDGYQLYPFAGGRIYLNIKESQMMLARALGMYEPDKTNTILELLKPGQTFLDIGANKGDFSLLAAKITGSTGQVISFEPEPENCHWFRNSTEANPYDNIQLFDLALADSNGTASLFLGEKSGWHSLVSSQGKTDISTIEVQKRTLDSILDEHVVPSVDMIKIDVEGAEMSVLQGATQTLNTNPDLIILLDLHPHMGVNPPEVCNFLSGNGFEIMHMKTPHPPMVDVNSGTTEILARRR